MYRALAAVVGLLLLAGVYTALAEDPPAARKVPEGSERSTSPSLGFALAAGIIALAATLLISRPRRRFRR